MFLTRALRLPCTGGRWPSDRAATAWWLRREFQSAATEGSITEFLADKQRKLGVIVGRQGPGEWRVRLLGAGGRPDKSEQSAMVTVADYQMTFTVTPDLHSPAAFTEALAQVMDAWRDLPRMAAQLWEAAYSQRSQQGRQSTPAKALPTLSSSTRAAPPPPPKPRSDEASTATQQNNDAASPIVVDAEEALRLLQIERSGGAVLYAAYRLLADHPQFFRPVGGCRFACRPMLDVVERLDAQVQRQKTQQRVADFVAHVQRGGDDAAERRRFEDVYARLRAAALSVGAPDDMVQQVLQALGHPLSPEGLYRLAVQLGFWREGANPHLIRADDEVGHSDAVVAEAQRLCASSAPWQQEDRWDLRKYPAYAIDQDGARERDDAISLVAQPNGQWVVVHVSDPTAFVPVGSAVDLAARERASSIHSLDMHLPMYPWPVVETCSFRADSDADEKNDRCALSIGVFINAAGQLSEYRMYPSLIRPTPRSFSAVDGLLARSPSHSLEAASLHKLLQLAKSRARNRGQHDRFANWSESPARSMVREFMVTAGICAATAAKTFRAPIPYCESSTASIPKPVSSSRPLSELNGAAYTRVTSPLRRYWDVMVHYQLRAALRNQPMPFTADQCRDIAADGYLRRIRLSHIEYSANRFRSLYALSISPRSTLYRVVVQSPRSKAVASDRYTVYLPTLKLRLDNVAITSRVHTDAEYLMKIDAVDPFRGSLRMRIIQQSEENQLSSTSI